MLFFLSAELWKHSSWLTQRPTASCIMCKLETGGTQDCRVISHKRFQTTTWQKLIHNMPTVDISETKTRQMEREFTKLCLEPQNWWVWGHLGQSDRHCIFFALVAYGWSCGSIYVQWWKIYSRNLRLGSFGLWYWAIIKLVLTWHCQGVDMLCFTKCWCWPHEPHTVLYSTGY